MHGSIALGAVLPLGAASLRQSHCIHNVPPSSQALCRNTSNLLQSAHPWTNLRCFSLQHMINTKLLIAAATLSTFLFVAAQSRKRSPSNVPVVADSMPIPCGMRWLPRWLQWRIPWIPRRSTQPGTQRYALRRRYCRNRPSPTLWQRRRCT